MSARMVFLSHTSKMARLPHPRTHVQAALDAVNAAGLLPRDMRFFTADDRPPAQLCVDTVRQCDIYVGLFGLDYGSPVRDKPEVSYTELEFDSALQEMERRGMRIFAFLLDEKTEGTLDERQSALRQRVLDSGVTAATFATPDRLEYLLHRALTGSGGPFAEYLSRGLAERCDRFFRPDNRFAFHPRDQFVPLSAVWDDGIRTEDIVGDLVDRLRGGNGSRLAVSANYGQGKTFLSWKLALTLAGRDDRSHLPLFYPLKELNPVSEKGPLAQVVGYLQQVLPGTTPDDLLQRRDSLLILDAADEISVSRENLTAVLREVLGAFNPFPRLALLLTFRSGLFPGGAGQYRTDLPGFHVAHLEAWQAGGSHWERLLALCQQTNYARFRGGWEHFRDEVAGPADRPRPLRDLTSRPLWCRMIIERRDNILGQAIRNEADLYRFYVDEFFKSRAGGAQHLTPDQKLRVLELLAGSMARGRTGAKAGPPEPAKVTEAELRRAAAQTFRSLPDSEIAEFLSGELRTHSLLNCEHYGGDRAFYSFGHNSFQEFFQALALLRLLRESGEDLAACQDDLAGIARRVLLSDDLLSFVVGLLRTHPAAHGFAGILRQKPERVFGSNSEEVQQVREALLRCWLGYSRRVLDKSRPDLVGFRLDRMTCDRLDLSGAELRGANLAGSRLLGCNFARTDLSDANCRGAAFVGCDLTSADFTDAHLDGVIGV